MEHERKLYPELEAHLAKLSERLGKLTMPLHAYIAGGVAVNYHTGIRMSDDVDIEWSHRVPIPPDMQVFEAVNPDDPTDVMIITMDGGFGDQLGSFPPDWKEDALVICHIGDIVLHVISPVDLAVSKVARFQDRDRDDIEALARFGLVSSQEFEKKAAEAVNFYVGDTTFIQYNIRDALELIKVIENERE
jgi:hypothetical protein